MSSGSSRRGLLVAVEGVDRAGKSTQCARLVQALQLQGIKARGMRFPDRTTPIGQLIDQYLRGETQVDDHVIHLLFSANRWEASTQIKEDIESGITLVLDRYYYSGCVYSAAKNIPGLDLEWARWPEVGLPGPDICIFLDLLPEKAQLRGGFGDEKYEKAEMQDRVRILFQEMLRVEPDRFRVIDAAKGREEVGQEILDAVLKEIDRVRRDDSGAALHTVSPIRA